MTSPQHPARRWPRAGLAARAALAGMAALALLAGCGGGLDGQDDTDPGHDDGDGTSIDTAGRLALTEAGSLTLRIHDLDTGSLEASHNLQNAPSALYASPGGRYAVVAQRTQGLVQFIDGGIWQEDHVDHLHDYRQASRALTWTLAGAQPTHYDVQAGRQAAVFMDGNSAAVPVQNAGVRLLTDASIARGDTAAAMDLDFPVHGLGEPVDDKLLTVSRAADAPDALPTHLNLYQRSGTAYNFVRELPVRCDGMHGSFSSGASTVAGCLDGMLLVRHLSATTVSDGQKLATPLRVGTLAGHPRLPDQFIGIATEGAAPAPVTTRFYAVDGVAGTVADFEPQGWGTGRQRRAHAFDRSGQRFFIIDDQGTLIVSQREGDAWTALARVEGAVPVMPAAAPWPAIAVNGARDRIYLTDPVAGQLVEVDSSNGTVLSRQALGFAPAAVAWLGITR